MIRGDGSAPTNLYPTNVAAGVSSINVTSLTVTPSLVKKMDPPSEMTTNSTSSSLCPAFSMKSRGIVVTLSCSPLSPPSKTEGAIPGSSFPKPASPMCRSTRGKPIVPDTTVMKRETSMTSHLSLSVLMKNPVL
ncbi:MAG: hypothetical protein A4E41_00014 [Methanoregulaceae archaeon PtaU1.Bin066]|nr:MAG: hypothetical protein A4E41_00014 [Methanoregulaceae archaeon PtaU1.Bin066]